MQASRKTRQVGLVLLLGCAVAAAQEPEKEFVRKFVDAALQRTRHTVRYDGSYRRIPYPGGDVPAEVGVCTDEIVRVYRALGIDLQKEVHEDMRGAFAEYPQIWGMRRPDRNIDHRRVPNLMRFFERQGAAVPATHDPGDYKAGDLVTWDLGGGVPHIGMVVQERSPDGRRPLIVHNIGAGPKLEDVLFSWRITGHYRYRGPTQAR